MRIATIGGVLLALGLAACGGGSGTGKADFIAAADTICADVNEQFASLGQIETEDEFIDGAREAIPVAEDAVDRLRALAVPTGDETAVAEIFDRFGETTDALAASVDALEAGDRDGFTRELQRVTELSNEGNQLAADYGFADCGEG